MWGCTGLPAAASTMHPTAGGLALSQAGAWLGSAPWGQEGKGQDHTNHPSFVWVGCQHPASIALGPWAWVQPGIPHQSCSTLS